MNKICGIYKITSPTNKIYIGQSVNIYRRINHYVNIMCIDQPKLYHSLVKYGWNAHIFEIIHECEASELNNLEKHYIKIFNSFNTEHGLNLTDGGEGANVTQETREKIRLCKIGVSRPTSMRKKLSNTKRGKPPHINCRHKPKEYEIYNQNSELIAKGKFNIKNKLAELHLPTYSFCKTYRENTKIRKGKYRNWFVVKL
jgi:group I intron endonuclease